MKEEKKIKTGLESDFAKETSLVRKNILKHSINRWFEKQTISFSLNKRKHFLKSRSPGNGMGREG